MIGGRYSVAEVLVKLSRRTSLSSGPASFKLEARSAGTSVDRTRRALRASIRDSGAIFERETMGKGQERSEAALGVSVDVRFGPCPRTAPGL